MKFTAKASAKVVEIAVAEGFSDPIVRVKVVGGGCAGFQYDMGFLDSEERSSIDPEIDHVFVQDGFESVMDPISAQYLEDVEIDYVTTDIGEGFKFNNPNVKGSCGCGSSVAF